MEVAASVKTEARPADVHHVRGAATEIEALMTGAILKLRRHADAELAGLDGVNVEVVEAAFVRADRLAAQTRGVVVVDLVVARVEDVEDIEGDRPRLAQFL